MQISAEGKLAILLGLFGIGGGGAVWVAPDHTEIGWVMIAFAIVGGIALAYHHFSRMLARIWQPTAMFRMLALFGTIIFGTAFFGCAVIQFWPSRSGHADNGSALARLAELGWTVRPTPDGIQFEIANRPLPPMKESSELLDSVRKPFRLILQSPASLDGLHHLSKVIGCERIDIGNGNFNDLTELQGFSSLHELHIAQSSSVGSGIIDSSPLQTLSDLRDLNIGSLRIRDLSFTRHLRQLKTLSLGQTFVSDISPLAEVTSLERLSISGDRINDLTPIQRSQRLSELTITDSQLPSIARFDDGDNKIIKLSLQIGVPSPDLSPLQRLNNLETLSLLISQKTDVRPLGSLTQLRDLSIMAISFRSSVEVDGIDKIGALINLRKLSLGWLPIQSAPFIRTLSHLAELSLVQMPLQSVDDIRGLKELTKVTLNFTTISDIAPLLDLPELVEVSVAGAPVRLDVVSALERRGVKVNR